MPIALRVGGDTYTTVYESKDELDADLQSARNGSIAIGFVAINGQAVSGQGDLVVRPLSLTSYAMWEMDSAT